MLGLSLIVPTIRVEHWGRVYDSMLVSCTKYPFEIIFVGPNTNLHFMQSTRFFHGYTNFSESDCGSVRFIKSLASPNKCQQLGLLEAKYDFVTHFADDAVLHPNMIDKCIDILLEDNSEKHVVLTKYSEGDQIVHNDDYYKLTKAYPKCRYIDDEWWIFNSAIFWREYLLYLGGWDSLFQVPCMGHADLAVRAQRDNCKISFIKESFAHCDHGQADHNYIAFAHGCEDAPLYEYIHNNYPDRIRISPDNHLNAPDVWRRFQ